MKETTFEEIKKTISCMIFVMKTKETREDIARSYTRIDGAINALLMIGLLTNNEEEELTKENMNALHEMYNKIKE